MPFINWILNHTSVITSIIAPILYEQTHLGFQISKASSLNFSVNVAMYALLIQTFLETVKKCINAKQINIIVISSLEDGNYIKGNTTNLNLDDDDVGWIFFKIIVNGKTKYLKDKKITINFPKQVDLDYSERNERRKTFEIKNNCNAIIDFNKAFNTQKDSLDNDSIVIKIGVQKAAKYVSGNVNITVNNKSFTQIDANKTNINGNKGVN